MTIMTFLVIFDESMKQIKNLVGDFYSRLPEVSVVIGYLGKNWEEYLKELSSHVGGMVVFPWG